MEKENAYKKINKIKQILLIIIFLLIIWIIGIIAGTYYFNLSNNKKENGGEISGINKGLQANTSTYVYEFSDVETINSISFKFKVTAKDLLESNPKIGEEYNLSVLDHKIVIPYITYYKVMTGDTIESISEKFDVEPNVLYDINIINPENKTIDKEEIMIPNTVVYTVNKGDSVKSIAKKYSVSEDSISKLNNLSSNEVVENQVLIIPKYYKNYNEEVSINEYSQKIYIELYYIAEKIYKEGTYKNYNKNENGYYLTLGDLKNLGHNFTDKITSCELNDAIVVFDIDHASEYEFYPIVIHTYCVK